MGIGVSWKGSGVDEVGLDAKTGKSLVKIDSRYFRPTEVDFLLGDAGKAKRNLGWEPRISFGELVKMMVREDLREAERDQLCKNEGFKIFDHRE